MSRNFKRSAPERLQDFLKSESQSDAFETLTPDASTREYFRITWNGANAVACVYAEQFDESLPQIDVTNLFLKSGLPVARIFNINYKLGIIIHEDFGNKIFRDVLEKSDETTRNSLLNSAISSIAQIQNSTSKALELDSIASRLKFDEEKLLWELNFFKTHYFGSLKKKTLPEDIDRNLTEEFVSLSRELEGFARVLTHRDFHAANLMVGEDGALKIIDHQDARIGSVAYDLVSLLLDRITETPSDEWLAKKKQFFLTEREKLGLPAISQSDFEYEFDLMTVQRCLKAIGTFSNQAGNLGKNQYVEFINPMFEVVSLTCLRLKKFPKLQKVIAS